MATETEFDKRVEDLFKKAWKVRPGVELALSVDAFGQGLEPHYYWVLDFLNSIGYEVEKFSDFFDSAAGSSFFSELGTKRSVMQDRAMKILETVNGVIRSIINLVFDLRDLEYRLNLFKEARGDPSKGIKPKEESELSLKSIWLTEVDINTGPAAIVNQARNRNATGLIDFFVWAKEPKDIDRLPAINERLKRILKGKFNEYNKWKEVAFRELTQKFNVEKLYLKSQVNSLKLYSRWAKPYLLSAQQLEERRTGDAGIVSTFDTIRLDVSFIGKKKFADYFAYESKDFTRFEAKTQQFSKKVEPAKKLGDIKKIIDGKIAKRADVLKKQGKGEEWFMEDGVYKSLKAQSEAVQKAIDDVTYYACVKVDFVFRSAPQMLRTEAGTGTSIRHTGRVDIKIASYALTETQLKELRELYKNDAFEFIDKITNGSLGVIAEDLQKYADEGGREKNEKKEEKKSSDIFGPAAKDMSKLLKDMFGGVFGLLGVGTSTRNFSKLVPIEAKPKLRKFADREALGTAKNIYKFYKVAHNMYTMFGEEA